MYNGSCVAGKVNCIVKYTVAHYMHDIDNIDIR